MSTSGLRSWDLQGPFDYKGLNGLFYVDSHLPFQRDGLRPESLLAFLDVEEAILLKGTIQPLSFYIVFSFRIRLKMTCSADSQSVVPKPEISAFLSIGQKVNSQAPSQTN